MGEVVALGGAGAEPLSPLAVRILDEFEARASRRGIRAVVMSELARDLGISTKTLYREFATKADLVHALMDRWTEQLQGHRLVDMEEIEHPQGRILEAVHVSIAHVDRFSSDFWRDLGRDYPDELGRFKTVFRHALRDSRDWLATWSREGVDMDLAGRLLMMLLRSAAEPRFCDELGMTRDEVLTAAVDVWANGALRTGPA